MIKCKIYIDAGGSSGALIIDGYRPAAFVAKLVAPDWAHIFYGMGNVRDIHVLDAHGLIMAIEHLSREAAGTDFPPVEIISGHPGFWERLEHIWSSELSKKVKPSNEHLTWRNLAILEGKFSLQAPRGPQGTAEAAELAKVKAERVRHAQDALDLPRGFFDIRTGSRPARDEK